MTEQPIGYEPSPRAARAIAAVWIAAAVLALACRRIHAHRRGIGAAFALAAASFAGWHARGVGPVTVGATRVDSASLPAGALPLGDPRLQPDYVDPLDETPAPPPMLQYAAPGGPDDGTAPSWLPAGLAPWWLDIVAAAHEHGLDSHAWGAIVAQECPWGDPSCGSHAGAQGLAQVMPATAADIEAQTGLPCRAQATDGPTSLRCGAWYFAQRVRDNGDLWQTPADDEAVLLAAAAAYNGGGPPSQDVRAAVQAGAGDVCASVRFAETRTYCYAFRERWRATLAERGAAPDGGAALPHLEALRP